MRHCLKVFFCLLFAAQITACAGLADMKKVDFVDTAAPDKALVNIVRPSVFVGDGAKVEVWDGEQFVGTLAAGTLIQYQATPGEHDFMVYSQGSWGIAKGELLPGKTYYLKFNIGFGFITLGVAHKNDPRIEEWNRKLSPMAVNTQSSKPVPEKTIEASRKMLAKIQDGSVKYEVINESNAL